MLKQWVKEEQNIYVIPKYLPTNYFYNYKGKMLIMEKRNFLS